MLANEYFMCLAIPGKIKKLLPNSKYALVDFSGVENKVNIELIKGKINDWIIVHAGFAIEKLTSKDAQEILKLMNADDSD
jgi:hydrogenase expression/formation protein HypC